MHKSFTPRRRQLVTQQASNPTSKNVMIILSDGDATACASGANTAAGGCNTKGQIVAENNPNCGSTGGSCLNGTPGNEDHESDGLSSPPPTHRRWASAGRLLRRHNWLQPREQLSTPLVLGPRLRGARRTKRTPQPPVPQTAQRHGRAVLIPGHPATRLPRWLPTSTPFIPTIQAAARRSPPRTRISRAWRRFSKRS
jgi:hypothetical protein